MELEQHIEQYEEWIDAGLTEDLARVFPEVFFRFLILSLIPLLF